METEQGKNNGVKLTSGQCGPGCDCGKPTGNKKIKAAVSLLVILAACGILVYKLAIAKTAAPARKNTGFSVNVGNRGAGADFQAQKTWAGEPLDSFASLNEKAINKNAVFICVPAPQDGTVSREAVNAINTAIQNLESHGINAGLYTLKPGSLDYAEATSSTPTPDAIVISRGGRAVMLSGALTQTNLMQAYVTSKSSGCSGSSCGCGSKGK